MYGVDIAVRTDTLVGLARIATATQPESAALTAALAAAADALAGLSSGAALAELGQVWARQADALHHRWRVLARDVEQARVGYADIDTGLAS